MLEQFIKKFPDARRNGVGYKAPCPAHTDETDNLSIREGEAGNIILLCSVGCQQSKILAAGGLTIKDLCPPYMIDSIDKEIEDLAEVIAAARVRDGEDLPDGYFLDDGRIFYRERGGDKGAYFVCSALTVAANTCDADNESWGRQILFTDARSFHHDLVIPMSLLSGDGTELRSRLMDCGLIISGSREGRQKFLQLLLTVKPTKHIRCVNQLGWHDVSFVLPDAVISANGNSADLLLQNVDRSANKFNPNGTLADWQQNVGRYCNGNSRLMFAVSLAFASAVLPLAGEPSGGFHIYGTSSTGKTTALLVAGSVWGGDPRKGFIETWRTTANGLEAVAELHNHCLLLLDEVSQVDPREIGETVYSLSNGFGKARMTRGLTARRKAEWNLLFLSSGEKTLEQIMQAIGNRLAGGQDARFVNIAADAGIGTGLFENLHGFETASDFAKHLSLMSRRFYGTPIRGFLKSICENRAAVIDKIKEYRQIFQARQDLQQASGEVYRVASRIALVTVAGILAAEFGIVDWARAEIISSGEKVFSEWLELRGTSGVYDVQQGVNRVLAFIERHGASRFQEIDPKRDRNYDPIGGRVSNRAGFTRMDDKGVTEYLILPDVFENEICNGNSPTAVAKELERKGHLRRGSEVKSLKARVNLPELGRKRVYVIVSEVLTDDDKEET